MADPNPRAIAVYCGSSMGNNEAYQYAAVSLAKALVKDGITLVYGGGDMGIMGLVSGTVASDGGRVVGVIPSAMLESGGEKAQVESGGDLKEDRGHNPKVEQVVVQSMHERKVEMARRAMGFIGLPGGFGTFEEVFEVTTWTQLNIHTKPVILLNICEYYSPLRTQIDNAVRDGFIQPLSRNFLSFIDGPPDFEEHKSFDWGAAAVRALVGWEMKPEWRKFPYVWTKEGEEGDALTRT